MKILITTPGLKFGGAERVLSILANQWIARGNDVAFFITATKEDPVYTLDENICVQYIDREKYGKGIPGLINGIRSYAKQMHADVIVSFMQDVAALTALAIVGLGIPIVYSERNDPNKTNTRRVDWIYRKIVEYRARYFVFQTSGARNCFGKVVKKKSRVILNPFDVALFPIHDFDSETNEIVAVGRLEPQKNYPVLIEAFAGIADKFPNINLSIYGEGSQRQTLIELINNVGLSDRIFLKGQVSCISEHVKDAKAFVMTSDYEGLPNALMEALAMGLPCVSTDCSPGGARAMINDGVSGYIVPCGDSLSVSDKLSRLLSDRALAKSFGQHALLIREKIESKKIASEWLSLFEEIIKRR